MNHLGDVVKVIEEAQREAEMKSAALANAVEKVRAFAQEIVKLSQGFLQEMDGSAVVDASSVSRTRATVMTNGSGQTVTNSKRKGHRTSRTRTGEFISAQFIVGGRKLCALCRKNFPATVEYFSRASHAKTKLASYCLPCGKLRKDVYTGKKPRTLLSQARMSVERPKGETLRRHTADIDPQPILKVERRMVFKDV